MVVVDLENCFWEVEKKLQKFKNTSRNKLKTDNYTSIAWVHEDDRSITRIHKY